MTAPWGRARGRRAGDNGGMTSAEHPDASAWTRERHGVVLTGSCAALARVLGLPVRGVRIAFVLGAALSIPAIPMLGAWDVYATAGSIVLTLAAPFVIGYLCLWWALPLDREGERRQALAASSSAVRGVPSAAIATAAPPTRQLSRWLTLAAIIGLGIIVLATAVIVPFGGLLTGTADIFGSSLGGYRGLVIAATGVLAAGLALGILPLDAVDRARWGGRVRSMPRLVLAALGTALTLLAIGVLWLVVLLFGSTAALITLVVTVCMLGLLAVVLVPWVLHLWNGMREETEERALVQQRSEFTAHLHDSVLQTLTLLQKSTTDPEEARRLARRQERELRRWLYHVGVEDPEQPTDVRGAVTALCEEIEDQQGIDVHVVVIGDAPISDAVRPLLGALRESTVNACRHGGVGVDVFVDVAPERLEAYVRDRGPGFDLADVPEDRLGVRESILGRMRRAGGTAQVRSAPGGGTEVALTLETPIRSTP